MEGGFLTSRHTGQVPKHFFIVTSVLVADVHPVEWDNTRVHSFPTNWKLVKTLPEEMGVCGLYFGPFSLVSFGPAVVPRGHGRARPFLKLRWRMVSSAGICLGSVTKVWPPCTPSPLLLQPESLNLTPPWEVPERFIPLKVSTVWTARGEVYTDSPNRWIEGLIVGRLLFSTQDGLFSMGFTIKRLLKVQWSHCWIFHNELNTISLLTAVPCERVESAFFFFPGRRRLLYKPQHWGNEIICVQIL